MTNEGDAQTALAAFVAGDRRRALSSGLPLDERPRGSALFADLSGFTALTEILANELGPQRGAEALTASLDLVFDALISTLDRYGGHVICFSGDAITCWLDADDGARATACALAMQARMDELADVVTPAGTRVRLAMKATVAVGTARRFVVGDPEIQHIDVLAGGLIDALATAERLANRAEVVLDASALVSLGERVVVKEMRRDDATGRQFGVVAGMNADVPETPAVEGGPELSVEALRRWLQPAVRERLHGDRDEFVAELRLVYPLFVRFGGIDYDNDEHAIAKLDAFICLVQHILAGYGGSLLHVTIGDKGAYIAAVFGAPVAHEDDAARACRAALDLRNLGNTGAVSDLQIGLAYGRARSGTCGHRSRKAFTCFGDAVNLAARLMTKAPSGQVYVSEPVRRAAGEHFTWETLLPFTVKGRSAPVSAFALGGVTGRNARRSGRAEREMVGRRAELLALDQRLSEALVGRGQLQGVVAEAGMGKSRLVAEFTARAQARDVVVAMGECQSYGAALGYVAWRGVWSTLFGLDNRTSDDVRVKQLEDTLTRIDPVLTPRLPLLSGLLNLPIPDNDLTAAFDAKLRKTSLEGLLVECLRARARDVPVLIVLEDCHWLDPLSRDLLLALARSLPGQRVLMLLAYRPGLETGAALGVEGLPHFAEMELGALDRSEVAELIQATLAHQTGGDAAVPDALVKIVMERADGNPFYVEELLAFIDAQGVDVGNATALRRLELPGSLQSLVLSRIDQLPEAPRRMIKVASVLGRAFRAPMLPLVHPALGTFDTVREDLRKLVAHDLVGVEREGDEAYAFLHVVTQEVAYESLPYAFRSTLHERAGQAIETTEADAIDRNLDVLAHHYGHSGNLTKKREYLGRAGDAARAGYANAAAIDYFERLAGLVEGRERIDVLLRLVKVLDVVGDWRGAERFAGDALALADAADDDHWRATSETALAEAARKEGRFDEAVARLERAQGQFAALGAEEGVGRVLHLMGTVAAQRGQYERAVECYEASLAIRQRLGDKASMASLLSNLGIVEEYRADFDGARAFHERALALRTEIGDRRAIGNSTNCLGMAAVHQNRHAEARDWFMRSMKLNREIGDSWMVAICHNNLGNATRGLGDLDAARQHYALSLREYRNYDDRWALAFLLEDIGMLAAQGGEGTKALELVGAAEAMREAIGAPRSPALEGQISAELAHANSALGDAERAAIRSGGRVLDVAAAVRRAESVVGVFDENRLAHQA